MRKARLAGARARAAADDRGGRRAVVRRAERRARDERPFRSEQARDRVDPRHLERLRRRERAAGSRAASGRASSCPSRAARRAGGCDRRRPRARAPGGPAPGRERRRDRAARARPLRRAARRRRSQLAAEVGDRFAEMPHRDRPAPRRARPRPQTPARRGSGRARCFSRPRRPRTRRARAGSVRPAQLTDRRVLREPLCRHLARGGEHRERDREVEARALLAQAGGREIDRDPPVERPLERRRRRRRSARDASPPDTRGRRGPRSRSRERRARGAPRPRRASVRDRPERG